MEIIKCINLKLFWIICAIAQAQDIIDWWWTVQTPDSNSYT